MTRGTTTEPLQYALQDVGKQSRFGIRISHRQTRGSERIGKRNGVTGKYATKKSIQTEVDKL